VTLTAPASFEDALASVRGVAGWLSDAQARVLFDHARGLPAGTSIVEIGSYLGRSTIVLARGAAPGVELVAIDPHAGNDRGPRQISGRAEDGQRDHAAFLANLERAGVRGAVRHVRRPSRDAGDAVRGAVGLLYVDGAHRYRPARDDILHWGGRLADGGTLLLHDSFCAVGVTLAQARLLLLTRRFRFIGRTGTLSEYRREDLTGAGRLVNVVSQLAQLPYLVRNLAVKLALLARLRPVARLLGQPSGEWPY
jgi:SAM-dependent methyltransferase